MRRTRRLYETGQSLRQYSSYIASHKANCVASQLLSVTGYLYTGLVDGRVIKINPQTETFDVLTRMGDPPYDDCG